MSVGSGSKNRSRLADQIEIIREPSFPTQRMASRLEESLHDLAECVRYLSQFAPTTGPGDRDHAQEFLSDLQRKLERFRKQSKLLKRIMTKVH